MLSPSSAGLAALGHERGLELGLLEAARGRRFSVAKRNSATRNTAMIVVCSSPATTRTRMPSTISTPPAAADEFATVKPRKMSAPPGRKPARKTIPPIANEPVTPSPQCWRTNGAGALDRLTRAETLERDDGDDEERRHRPREVGEPAEDRGDEAPAGLAQQRLHDRDQRTDDELHARPGEDHVELLPRRGEALADRRVLPFERPRRARGQRDAAEHADHHEQVEPDHDHHDPDDVEILRST